MRCSFVRLYFDFCQCAFRDGKRARAHAEKNERTRPVRLGYEDNTNDRIRGGVHVVEVRPEQRGRIFMRIFGNSRLIHAAAGGGQRPSHHFLRVPMFQYVFAPRRSVCSLQVGFAVCLVQTVQTGVSER